MTGAGLRRGRRRPARGLRGGGRMADGKRNPRTANGTARRSVRAWLRAQGRPCAICGQPIDYSLPPGHPLSFEVDEIIPVSLGGSPVDRANVQPAHRICNQRKGNRIGWRPDAVGPRPLVPPRPTTDW